MPMTQLISVFLISDEYKLGGIEEVLVAVVKERRRIWAASDGGRRPAPPGAKPEVTMGVVEEGGTGL